ncbi:MAG: UDP-glucose--hexose-1-phosphate uridylyltransferase [Clostridia bacterium]|nr:UDP-glucose--hexose-1-phosphate uridylyltransferase [Clostridia bacterium]
MKSLTENLRELALYAKERGLLRDEDEAFVMNAWLALCRGKEIEQTEPPAEARDLAEILSELCDIAAENGVLDKESITERDLFDTALMGVITPRPSEVIDRFNALYKTSPEAATDGFYKMQRDVNYIRTARVARDMKWQVETPYGVMDITVNLSKPEKDPKAIAAARTQKASAYPKCLLCHECEGFAGDLSRPARQNLRQIPMTMAGKPWYLQYSPYVYYNEHCIALSAAHEPMRVDRMSFVKALDFVEAFPHYFIGQNADLPIVGGSILAHDHMQGGRYEFAMAKAPIKAEVAFRGFEGVKAGILCWPMSVLRLESEKKEDLVALADKILGVWRGYSDMGAEILSHSGEEPHNTITPIARRKGARYQLDLVLRNNRTTKEHPLGLFHPHAELHNIKKENIGLIEVMGLAVLPARLKGEMEALERAILSGARLSESEQTAKHAAWLESFRSSYTFTEENTHAILLEEIGKTFVRVLEDAGVYKNTPAGDAAFMRFVDAVNKA